MKRGNGFRKKEADFQNSDHGSCEISMETIDRSANPTQTPNKYFQCRIPKWDVFIRKYHQ